MTKFCVNCGHSNNDINKVCINCGTTFTVSTLNENHQGVTQKSSSEKTTKVISLKRKILTVLTISLLIGVVGFSFWGKKTASAETTVSKFIEALQTKDSKTMSKIVVLSSGELLTENEAKAFINLYHDVTTNELEEILSVEKSGKVLGLFNAHKIVLTAQDLSYYFPYDGLALKIGEKTYRGKKNAFEEYIFSNIPPGVHRAEFIFKGEITKYNHPFELTVYQEKENIITSLQEELPLETVTFELENYDEGIHVQSAILINGQEFPLNDYGQSEEIGPLLLDGSQLAQGKQHFPWGVQLTDKKPITESYMNFSITNLDATQKTALIDQLLLFGEETIEAFATRNPEVYTTLTDEMLNERSEEISSMVSMDYFYKGALSEINLDEESLQISEDGYSVSLNAEIVTRGDEYYDLETPEMEDVIEEAIIYFIYDVNNQKWMVNGYSVPWFSSNSTYSMKIEGSKKVYETDITPEDIEDESEDLDENLVNSTDDIQLFFNLYNSMSVAAINEGDFSLVSNLITSDGPRRKEQAKFINNLYDKGITEEHINTSVEEVKEINDSQWKVTTNEKFVIHGTEQSNEKSYRTVTIIKKVNGNWLVHELVSTTEI